eukprot:Clim_evm9s40 gene=Clim_evmTU9s40
MVEKKKAEETNIKVVVRCRPRNNVEKAQNNNLVVRFPRGAKKNREHSLEVQHGPYWKTYSYDQVFGPDTSQVELYLDTVKPIVEEVLQGYNCTIFAYGQTGTGKTHTMVGPADGKPSFTGYAEDTHAGIVPRALEHVFDVLEAGQSRPDNPLEFSVRVSYVELYNEELKDLLAPEDVGHSNSRLKIFEDPTRRGATFVQGAEEVVLNNRHEVYDILQRGQARRATAATKLNEYSSRSHSVFSITLHMKEASDPSNPDEELLRIGKLNLVDLAGSECIGRSGAVNDRAREAGNINQSLLTLGRVINALVGRTSHVPYRESKLTRLLQDSLGGRTKTCIVATISPANNCIEETLSTLDYALRAKDIKNKPEVNAKLSKKAVLKEYNAEIERLRRDLTAAREKNGVFLSAATYEAMDGRIKAQENTITELQDKIAAAEKSLQHTMDMFESTKMRLQSTTRELDTTKGHLKVVKDRYRTTRGQLKEANHDIECKETIISHHSEIEESLHTEAQEVVGVASESINHVDRLHAKVQRQKEQEEANLQAARESHTVLMQQFTNLSDLIAHERQRSEDAGVSQQHLVGLLKKSLENGMADLNTKLGDAQTMIANKTQELISTNQDDATQLSEQCQELSEEQQSFRQSMEDSLQGLETRVRQELESVQDQLNAHTTVMNSFMSNLESHNKKLMSERDSLSMQLATMAESLRSVVSEQIETERKQAALQVEKAENAAAQLHTGMDSHVRKIQANLVENLAALMSYSNSGVSDLLDTHIKQANEEFLTRTATFDSALTENLSNMHSVVQTRTAAMSQLSSDIDGVVDEAKSEMVQHSEQSLKVATDHNTAFTSSVNAMQGFVSQSSHTTTEVLNRIDSVQADRVQTMNSNLQDLAEYCAAEVTEMTTEATSEMKENHDSVSTDLTSSISKNGSEVESHTQQSESVLGTIRTVVDETHAKKIKPTAVTLETPAKKEFVLRSSFTRSKPYSEVIAHVPKPSLEDESDDELIRTPRTISQGSRQGFGFDITNTMGGSSGGSVVSSPLGKISGQRTPEGNEDADDPIGNADEGMNSEMDKENEAAVEQKKVVMKRDRSSSRASRLRRPQVMASKS